MTTNNSINSTALGTMSTQNANAIAVTGGTISGLTGFSSNATTNTFGAANSGAANLLLVTNSSTPAGSDAVMEMRAGALSFADAYLKFTLLGSTTWVMGCDNSDTQSLVIGRSTALGTNNIVRIGTDNQMTLPKQSAFSVYNSTTRSNVTGDGTNYTIPFNTNIFDQNADFNTTTGTFTSPFGGKYPLTGSVFMAGLSAAYTSILISVATSNRTYQIATGNGSMRDVNNNVIIPVSILADMDAADIANIIVNVSGFTKAISISSTPTDTVFTGYLAV